MEQFHCFSYIATHLNFLIKLGNIKLSINHCVLLGCLYGFNITIK